MRDSKILNINRLDAHDRLQHFTQAGFDIGETVESIRKSRPFGDYPFYIFAHARTDDKSLGTKRLIWQPRLTKPHAQTNSMLFKVDPKTDIVKIIWMLPERAMWPMYEKGKLTENEIVATNIYDFQHNRKHMEAKDPDDLADEVIDKIYREISRTAASQRSSAVSSTAFSKSELRDQSTSESQLYS